MADNASKSTVEITGDIVAAYLGNNTIGAAQLPELIEAVHKSLRSISDAPAAAGEAPAPDASVEGKRGPGRPRKADPQGTAAPEAAPAKTSRRPGRRPAIPRFPSLRHHARLHRLPRGREAAQNAETHLNTNYGMTPAAYRQKWGLPPDYPMWRRTTRSGVPRPPSGSAWGGRDFGAGPQNPADRLSRGPGSGAAPTFRNAGWRRFPRGRLVAPNGAPGADAGRAAASKREPGTYART